MEMSQSSTCVITSPCAGGSRGGHAGSVSIRPGWLARTGPARPGRWVGEAAGHGLEPVGEEGGLTERDQRRGYGSGARRMERATA